MIFLIYGTFATGKKLPMFVKTRVLFSTEKCYIINNIIVKLIHSSLCLELKNEKTRLECVSSTLQRYEIREFKYWSLLYNNS